jgi:hypothetical protein
VLESFHPLVRTWFEGRFGAPTEPQARAWPAIATGEDVLVSAPTGSGKTLAAFLSALDGLLREGLAGGLPEATRVVYVSPLRALSNDVERNLLGPLAELTLAAARAGHRAPELRVAVRTGDTPGSRRQALLRRPPHILVTTPESLYLLLTAERGRGLLSTVEAVIVDEIHALARDKRGARYAALTGAGAIPDTAQYAVVVEPEGAVVGQVDEDFAVESMGGDVFLLGNHSWRVLRVEAAARIARGWVPHLGPFTAASLGEPLGLTEADAAIALGALEADGLVLRGRFLEDVPGPHFCERTALARIHRATLGRLRREIEPVSTADLVRFLLRWQHLAPGTQLHGPRGLAEVVGQLQGFHAAAGAWEPELLARRVAGYAPADLDALCHAGEVAWGRLSPRELEAPPRRAAPTRAAPITLALREDLPWLLAAARAGDCPSTPPAQSVGPAQQDRSRRAQGERGEVVLPEALPPAARELLAVLRTRGASFLAELAAATRRARADVEDGLWALVAAGLATCDGFAGLRVITQGDRRAGVAAGGRWTLLGPVDPPGEVEGPPLLERLAQQYLRRYGVVFRDLLAREDAPPWRELVRVYRTLEARGSIRGGRFAAGRSGEQFALPEAVDALRAVRRLPRTGAERVELSAADPLNLVGVVLPGARVPAVAGGRVVYVDGVPEAEPRVSVGVELMRAVGSSGAEEARA